MTDAHKLVESFPEINPNNYNHEDVVALNDWAIQAADWIESHQRTVGAAPVNEAEKEIPTELYTGHEVYTCLTDQELGRTSPTNVSDVLNAVVRLIRKNRAARRGEEG